MRTVTPVTVCDGPRSNCGNPSRTEPDRAGQIQFARLRAHVLCIAAVSQSAPSVICPWNKANPPKRTDAEGAIRNPSCTHPTQMLTLLRFCFPQVASPPVE